jgi:CTD kinase subunit beta
MKHIGYDETREDGYRLKGIQLIDSVRQSLHLCVRFTR